MQNRKWLATEKIYGGSQLGKKKKKKEKQTETEKEKKRIGW